MCTIETSASYNERRCAVEYLQITTCFFNDAYGSGKHKSYFNIRHVYKRRLQRSNHKINNVSMKYSTAPKINSTIDEQNSYTQCKKHDIMNYSPVLSISVDGFRTILKKYGVEDGGIKNIWISCAKLKDLFTISGEYGRCK